MRSRPRPTGTDLLRIRRTTRRPSAARIGCIPSEGAKYGIQYASGGPNAGHCYVASLAQHYYLTGDRNSRDAFLEVAGWTVDSPWFDKRMMGDTRGIGNFLMTHVYAYELTQDPKYYCAALTMVDWVDEPFSGLGGNLFAKAAGRFLDMKADNGERDADYKKVLDKLLAFGELYLTLPDSATANPWNRVVSMRKSFSPATCTRRKDILSGSNSSRKGRPSWIRSRTFGPARTGPPRR